MAHQVFIDGAEGTTGLQLRERLLKRADITLVDIEPHLRKDDQRRAELINAADIVFLCLPDEAAKEAVALCTNPHTVIIDASTAHRTNDAWAYGLPELSSAHRAAIAASKRIANPGCYASGAIAILYPLVKAGIISAEQLLSIHAVSGYSGAGKRGIAQYQDARRDAMLTYPRLYALELHHKHVPEISKISGLKQAPIFNPLICDYYAGMSVTIPLFRQTLAQDASVEQIKQVLTEHYQQAHFITVNQLPEDGFIPAGLNTGSNMLSIFVFGNQQQITITSVLDNLGKGASGAAVQNMNIALGLDETAGLS